MSCETRLGQIRVDRRRQSWNSMTWLLQNKDNQTTDASRRLPDEIQASLEDSLPRQTLPGVLLPCHPVPNSTVELEHEHFSNSTCPERNRQGLQGHKLICAVRILKRGAESCGPEFERTYVRPGDTG